MDDQLLPAYIRFVIIVERIKSCEEFTIKIRRKLITISYVLSNSLINNSIRFNDYIIINKMPFWSRKKKQVPVSNNPHSTVVIMQSEVLGMTVIEEDLSNNQETKELSIEEWIDIIQTQQMNGYPFERLYFTFLKGIPTFLRMKIWMLLCSQNCAKNFHYSSKNDQPKKGSGLKISELTIQIYKILCENEPQQKQKEQIQKDVRRSFSIQKVKYKYVMPLLRKLLYASSNSGIEYTQGMNYILLNIIIYCLQSIGVNQANIDALQPHHERDIFIVFRETIIRMNEVFGQNNIFKVLNELQERITESVPEVLYVIYQCGLDSFSAFSQNYYSVMSYNDPPEDLSKQMLDLFFLTGEKAIHATIVKMLMVTKQTILNIKNPQKMQSFLKSDIYHEYYKTFTKQKQTAKSISDFGLCFFDSIQRLNL